MISVNATSSIVIVAMVMMMIQVIVVIVIAVRAVMNVVMMPTTLMVMVIIGGIRLARRQWVKPGKARPERMWSGVTPKAVLQPLVNACTPWRAPP